MRIELERHDEWGLSWVAAEPAFMERGSHALRDGDGGVWLVDPVDGDGLDEALAGLGEVRGVVQLIDRHGRDCEALAERYGAPLLRIPREGIPALGAESVVVVDAPGWREVALWLPRPRILVVGESIGTAGYYVVPPDRVGLHPLGRLRPPRALGALAPLHLLPGHGRPVSGVHLTGEIARALSRARRDLPRAWLRAARASRRR